MVSKDRCFAVNKTEDFIRLDGLDNLVRKAKQSTKPGKQVHTSRLLSSGMQWMLQVSDLRLTLLPSL